MIGDRISGPEERSIKFIQLKHREDKLTLKSRGRREGKREGKREIIWKKKSDNFLNLMNAPNLHIRESEQTLSGINPKKSMLKYNKIKLWKLNTKKKNWKKLEINDTLFINWIEC